MSKDYCDNETSYIAKKLLGKLLVRRMGRRFMQIVITEVEAYDGFNDMASHASRGKTKRNEPMFGAPGKWYIYLCYGTHWMLNIVTGKKGYPAAVLIRCGITLKGEKINGPGKITKYLNINKELNGKAVNKKNRLWIANPSFKEKVLLENKFGAIKFKINRGPRIGVNYAGPVWSKKQLRFWINTK